MDSSNPTPKRKRRAQPGNANAVKSGRFARQAFPPGRFVPPPDPYQPLKDEVKNLIRFVKRILRHPGACEDIEKYAGLLIGLTTSLFNLARLLSRANALNTGEPLIQAIILRSAGLPIDPDVYTSARDSDSLFD